MNQPANLRCCFLANNLFDNRLVGKWRSPKNQLPRLKIYPPAGAEDRGKEKAISWVGQLIVRGAFFLSKHLLEAVFFSYYCAAFRPLCSRDSIKRVKKRGFCLLFFRQLRCPVFKISPTQNFWKHLFQPERTSGLPFRKLYWAKFFRKIKAGIHTIDSVPASSSIYCFWGNRIDSFLCQPRLQ